MVRVVVFWAIGVLVALSCPVATAKTSSSTRSRRSRQTKLCNKVDGCPTIATLEASIAKLESAYENQTQINAELAAALEVQTEINSLLAGQVAYQGYSIQALQNASSGNSYVPPNSVLPFNETVCRAIPYTNYTNNGTRGWVFFGLSEFQPFKSTCSVRYQTAPTCAQLCAGRGRACDPCAISKLGCQDAMWWAFQQARLTQEAKDWTIFRKDLNPPGPPGPWTQSICPNETFDGSAGSIGYSLLPGNTFVENICFNYATTYPDQNANTYDQVGNYYNKADNSTYRNPSTLCDIPMAYNSPGNNADFTYSSTPCYCV